MVTQSLDTVEAVCHRFAPIPAGGPISGGPYLPSFGKCGFADALTTSATVPTNASLLQC